MGGPGWFWFLLVRERLLPVVAGGEGDLGPTKRGVGVGVIVMVALLTAVVVMIVMALVL